MFDIAKIAGLLLAISISAPAQQQPTTPSPSQSKPSPGAPKKDPATIWKKFCAPEGDYCVRYPPNWETLGDPADTGGLVIAPPQPTRAAAQWSSVTVAATDLPEPVPGKDRATFDELIALVLGSMRPGIEPQTLERKHTTVGDLPAQILKLSYTDENGQAWIEEIALMDADDVIYSVALRCTPDELATLEPYFKQIVATWKLIELPVEP